jgi:hypothetical protein
VSGEEKEKNEIPTQKDITKNASGTSFSAPLIARAVANIIAGSSIITFPDIVLSSEKKKSIAEEKAELMKELAELNVDPETFDALLTNELDRKLKVSFGVAFLILTCLFTTASYAIIIFDAIYDWGISEIAITALVIETPIQFIGLLYIIARNLFPQSEVGKKLTSQSTRTQ